MGSKPKRVWVVYSDGKPWVVHDEAADGYWVAAFMTKRRAREFGEHVVEYVPARKPAKRKR